MVISRRSNLDDSDSFLALVFSFPSHLHNPLHAVFSRYNMHIDCPVPILQTNMLA